MISRNDGFSFGLARPVKVYSEYPRFEAKTSALHICKAHFRVNSVDLIVSEVDVGFEFVMICALIREIRTEW